MDTIVEGSEVRRVGCFTRFCVVLYVLVCRVFLCGAVIVY